MSFFLTLAALLVSSAAEESFSPEKLLKPRNFNPHPYETPEVILSKFYKHLTPEPTQQGPVLFPNDAPPPPKPPLIVTARPLEESISRSELNPTPLNNSIAQSSYLNRVRILRPNYTPLNFKPNLSKPNLYNPGAYKPDLYNADAYKPDLYKADAYKPDLYKADAYKPDLYKGDAYKPDLYKTDAYKPDLYKGDAYKPDFYKADAYKPDIYNSDIYKSNVYNPLPTYNPTIVPYKNQLNYGPINFYKKPLVPINSNLEKHNLDAVDDYDEGKATDIRHPYASLVKKSKLLGNEDEHRYNDFEEQTILPPIYRALSDYAQQKVLKTPRKPSVNSLPPQSIQQKVKSDADDYNDYSNDVESESAYGKKYAFSYSVKDHKTGDDFSHSQRSSGSATNGEYRVRLPDGRMQIVSYTADEGGYKADVRYADDDNIKPVVDNTIEQPKHENNRYGLVEVQPRRNYNTNDYYNYDSKEYNDYKYGNNIQYQTTPAASKFGPIIVTDSATYDTNKVTTPNEDRTVLITPTRNPYFLTTSKYDIPVDINVPWTTAIPYARPIASTERVVNIGGFTKSPILYTSIRNRLSHSDFSQVPIDYSTVSPNNYVSSTLSPIDTSLKPSFVSRLSKYLSFN